MKLRQLMRVLLFWSTLYLQERAATVTQRCTVQIKPKITVSAVLGKATKLQCRNETSKAHDNEKSSISNSIYMMCMSGSSSAHATTITGKTPDSTVAEKTIINPIHKATEGLAMWWQTPFGSFGERYEFSAKDPIEMSNGSLWISEVTLSHTGLYSCHLVDSQGTTVIPYRVNVLKEHTHKPRTRIRTAREAVTSDIHYSDTQFAAAVSSSVLVTFIGAFTFGAFSQPYVIKCLQRTKARMCPDKHSHQRTRFTSHIPRTVFFHRNPNSCNEDTVDFTPESSASIKPPSNIKGNQENQEGAHLDSEKVSRDASEQSDQAKDHEVTEEQKARKGSEMITRDQPKRVSRVIKLYNYDEDGNRYGHIKEPEDTPTPRQRVMSLTRLQSIMKETDSPDFSTSREDSTEPDDALCIT